MKDTPISLTQVLSILAKHEAKYPLDLFPEDGTSQDCATARFARWLIHSIIDDVAILDDVVELAETEESQPPVKRENWRGYDKTLTPFEQPCCN